MSDAPIVSTVLFESRAGRDGVIAVARGVGLGGAPALGKACDSATVSVGVAVAVAATISIVAPEGLAVSRRKAPRVSRAAMAPAATRPAIPLLLAAREPA